MTEKPKIKIGPLDTQGGVLTEKCRVYRQMRRGEINGADGERLIRCLTAIRQGYEAKDIERRLDELEAKGGTR